MGQQSAQTIHIVVLICIIQVMTTPQEEGIWVDGNQLQAIMENSMELIG